MVHVQRPLDSKLLIEKNLNDMSTLTFKADVGKECHVVGVSIIFDRKLRRSGHNHFTAVRRKYFDLGFKLAGAYPMIHDCKFQQGRGKPRQKNIFKQSHQGKLITHFQANVVANDRINELSCVHWVLMRAQRFQELVMDVVKAAVGHNDDLIA
jgi:hypothetical protein